MMDDADDSLFDEFESDREETPSVSPDGTGLNSQAGDQKPEITKDLHSISEKIQPDAEESPDLSEPVKEQESRTQTQ